MPPANQHRQRSKVTNAVSKKKRPDSQRGYKATHYQQNVPRFPLRERPPLWIAPEFDGERSSRDGIWLAPSKKKA
jgi:hypothetical protein